jgi:uncharacterized protein YndB with AHSA1/START domain
MKNFDWTSFTVKILVKASMENVYNAWTSAPELERWFVKKAFIYDNMRKPVDRSVQATSGYYYEWTWHLIEARENGKYLNANGKDHIQFTFAGDCVVDVRLSVKEEYTFIELTQKDIPVDELSKQEIRLKCHKGWSFYLVNLKSVCEGGLDLRNKDVHFRPMVNN